MSSNNNCFLIQTNNVCTFRSRKLNAVTRNGDLMCNGGYNLKHAYMEYTLP